MPKPARIPLPTAPSSESRFTQLVRHVQGCRACPRMEGRKRVLSQANGTVPAPSGVIFVAEAPGRNGADRTGIPLYGDPTGMNFERLLASAGWTRADVFVTNCVLCNPRDAAGNNDTPTGEEVANCSFNLADTIRVVNPKVVATLGAKALGALSLIEPHAIPLRGGVGKVFHWFGRYLIPLYHPSPRALIHRSMKQQAIDFTIIKETSLAATDF